MRLNASLKREVDGIPAPDAADEVMLYQLLIGAWPLGDDTQGVEDRVAAWQEKAVREAKRRSEWAVPNQPYEQACREFLAAMMAPDRASHLAAELAAFAHRLAPAGAINGLAQLVLRCTAPGVPDLYQGTEFWDFSLVDPDNRRPVDWAGRAAALDGQDPEALLPHWRDGRIKQALLARLLARRAAQPQLFAAGEYMPLMAEGPAAGHVLAFARRLRGQVAVSVVTRLSVPLLGQAELPHVPPAAWQGTTLALPRVGKARSWRDALTGRLLTTEGDQLPLGDILSRLPVALLEVA